MTTPLPTTLILSYIGRDTTAPRLRRTITWSLRAIATLHALAAFAILYFTASGIYQRFTMLTMFGRRTPLADALRDFGGVLALTIPLLLLISALAITLLTGAGPASRGSHAAAVLTTLCLIPYCFLLPVLAAASSAIAILTLLDPHPNRSVAAYFLFLPVAILIVLLLKDLLTCINWASTNPTDEKPRTPFLPARPLKPPPPP